VSGSVKSEITPVSLQGTILGALTKIYTVGAGRSADVLLSIINTSSNSKSVSYYRSLPSSTPVPVSPPNISLAPGESASYFSYMGPGEGLWLACPSPTETTFTYVVESQEK
jgi:hypothetical protein